MIRINGKSIVKGIAIGRILKFSKKENPVKRTKITGNLVCLIMTNI